MRLAHTIIIALKIRELKEGYGFYVYETANKTHTKVEFPNLSQLIRLNLSTGDFDYIRIGVQLEWPKLSPNNQRVACIRKISFGTRSQPPSRNVMIDTQLLFEYKGRYSIRVGWIDDETVAVSLDREILAIDVSTKVIKARIPVH